MIKDRIVIIDGNSLINRAFYALPPLTTKEGKHTNAIYGFLTMLIRVLEDYKPEYISVTFDKKKPTFRHVEYDQYKAGRKKMPMELSEQMEPLKDVLDILNIHRLELDGFEADDLIGTVAKESEGLGMEVLIVTGDKDALQLASDKIKVLITKKGISSLEIYDENRIKEEYELIPNQLIDLKGLMGDKSDNIPGVPGVGEKTALKLIREFGSIENLINNIDKVDGVKLREKIENNMEQAVLSKRLGTIVTQVPIELNIDELKRESIDIHKVTKTFSEYEFTSLLNKVSLFATKKDEELVQEKNSISYLIDNREEIDILVNKILENKKMSMLSITEQNNVITDKILAIAISLTADEQFFIDLRNKSDEESEYIFAGLKEVLENDEIKIISHDIKKEIIHFSKHNIHLSGVAFDIMVAEYLLDPSRSSYGLKELAAKYFGENLMDEEELLGKGKSKTKIVELTSENFMEYLCKQVNIILLLQSYIEQKLKDMEMESLYYNVELPLIEVLASMELVGIKVDKQMLLDFQEEYNKSLFMLTDEIYKLAGEQFNINSPKQLGEILFNKLGLPVIKKTKTGYSTNVEVLEKLYDQHEIIGKILEYRQINKVKTTYVDGLLNIINPVTNRVHSNFNQTVTATGRISSTEPNLQNIPVRLEMGRRLRKVFIAEDNNQLIDADYSQIELRVLAHISGDNNLIEAFRLNQDIHTRTASEIFNVPIEDVTSSMRSDAKAVNFGIVYGISDFGLSENLNISRQKAKQYIDNYLERYEYVKKYMNDSIEMAKNNGYVVTILNRRRYLPEVQSKNFNIRSFGERVAMNSPIQGSAADIIKIAMINVYRKLKEQNLKSKLILQVHDELIVESPIEEVEKASAILKESMEEAVKLDVELKVDLSIAQNWYDAK